MLSEGHLVGETARPLCLADDDIHYIMTSEEFKKRKETLFLGQLTIGSLSLGA